MSLLTVRDAGLISSLSPLKTLSDHGRERKVALLEGSTASKRGRLMVSWGSRPLPAESQARIEREEMQTGVEHRPLVRESLRRLRGSSGDAGRPAPGRRSVLPWPVVEMVAMANRIPTPPCRSKPLNCAWIERTGETRVRKPSPSPSRRDPVLGPYGPY